MSDEYANGVIKAFEAAQHTRQNFDSQFEDIRKLVRPDTLRFNQGVNTPGQDNYEIIYDGTAQDASEELASGLVSHVVNPADRFFDLVVDNMDDLRFDNDALIWLERVAQIIYDQYSIDASRFNLAMDEVFLDIVSFGTGVVYQYWSPQRNHLMFRTYPLASCYMLEDNDEIVDTVFRTMRRTRSQLIKQFGESELPQKVRESKEPNKQYTLIHAVMPRIDRQAHKLTAVNKPYASDWVILDTKETIKKHGYDFFPYHTPRWRKYADEVFGRSCAMTCINDIKMLQKFEYLLIKAGTKIVDPPLLVPNDGFMLPIKTHPGAMNFKEPDAGEIEKLPPPENLPFSIEQANQKREFVRKCFHNDWLRMEKEKVEMTAYEVQDRREEKLRLLAPSLSRIEMELLSPMISLSYNMLQRAGRIPAPPPILEGRKINIEYTSPASRAQLGIKVIAMDRYIQRLATIAQFDPSVMDNVDLDTYAQDLSVYQGTPRRIIRDPKAREMIRAEKNREAQLQQIAQLAEPATKAVKNLAEANKQGGLPT